MAVDLYTERMNARTAAAAALRRRERTLALIRLGTAALALVLVFFFPIVAVLPAAGFVVLVVAHERAIRRREREEAGAEFYRRGLARLTNEWQGKGDGGSEFAEEHHPYASDLDLFGRGSLFELISTAVTGAGRSRLAEWLRSPASDADEIRARQQAVSELRDRVDLRERLAVTAARVKREVEQAKLEAWGSSPAVGFAPWERALVTAMPWVATAVLALTLPAAIARLIGLTHPEAAARLGVLADVPLWPLIALIVVVWAASRRVGHRVAAIIGAVERAEPALALLGSVLEVVESESFTAPRLQAAGAKLRAADGNETASRQIERLRKLVALLDARRNQFFAPIAALVFWTPSVAARIERWRSASGVHVADWIDAVADVEALGSLAGFAFEHPSFAMPRVAAEGPLFDAVALGHPLIDDARRVTNDLRLDGSMRLLIVSGSNMSGKSTMLRSVGVASVLAMAGSVVCAQSLGIAPMAVGAAIRLGDSLQEGASRFYAEILRIRLILEMARTRSPMLFLLDEVLAGTNSHDRRIGAEAIVRGLLARGAIGLASTHDLALAKIADELAPRAANVHFEDHLEGDRVVFDYRMRPGVVTRSNALALMRSVGIEV